MALSDRVAVVALVVSLSALVVSLTQLFLSLFGTADGYRRCAESVIGPWHLGRHRRLRLSELRLVTKFITPQIALLSYAEFQSAAEEHEAHPDNGAAYKNVHFILDASSSIEWKKGPFRMIGETVHDVATLTTFTKEGSIHPQDTKTKQKTSDEEKNTESRQKVAMKTQERISGRRLRRKGIRTEQGVSWLELLRQLHLLYSSYWPENCDLCHRDDWRGYDWEVEDSSDIASYASHGSPSQTDGTLSDAMGGREVSNRSRTEAAVVYRQWNWDFMPPELAKPLAESTVGDIVVLAMRLGMQWRDVDVAKNSMHADGNGFSLSSFEIRGLGIVLRFSASGEHDSFPRIAPIKAADKLLCGIIPGDPELVKEDFPFVGNDRKLYRIEQPGGILEKFGVTLEEQELTMGKDTYREVHNELIALLCPFLAVEGSTIGRNLFPGWRDKVSVFHLWESRLSILRAVEQRYQSQSSHHGVYEELHKRLQGLCKAFPADFFCRYGKSAIINHRDELDFGKKELLQRCRAAHQSTTKLLKDFCMHKTEKQSAGQYPQYLHLVAAHAYMAQRAMKYMHAHLKEEDRRKPQDDLRRKHNITNEHGAWFNIIFYETAEEEIRHVRDEHVGIGQHLRSKDVRINGELVNDDQAEALWYILMLRGISWDMSTWTNTTNGDPVPSSLYNVQTPVWII